jgi:hypothetical protein
MNQSDLPPFRCSLWDRLLAGDRELLEELIALGKKQSEFYERVFETLANDLAYRTEFDGHPAIAVNYKVPNSTFFDHCDIGDAEVMLAYRRYGNHYSISVYSAPGKDIDCAALARKYGGKGGGGRTGAAGFSCNELPFEQKGVDGKQPVFKDPYATHRQDFLKMERPRSQWVFEDGKTNNLAINAVVNHPSLFFDPANDTSRFVAYVWTNCGQYRVIDRYANDPEKPDGKAMGDGTYWSYSDDCPC